MKNNPSKKSLEKRLAFIEKNIQTLHDMESEEARKRGLSDALSVIKESK